MDVISKHVNTNNRGNCLHVALSRMGLNAKRLITLGTNCARRGETNTKRSFFGNLYFFVLRQHLI